MFDALCVVIPRRSPRSPGHAPRNVGRAELLARLAGRSMVDVMVTTSEEPGPTAAAGADPPDPPVRRSQPVSARGPALVVLGIAVCIVLAGVLASAFDSGNVPTTSLRSIAIRDGTVVPLTPATVAMKRIVSASEPPGDIIGNMAVPTGSPVTHVVNTDQGQGQFDRTVYFTTQLSSDQVVDLYRTLLPRLGWRVLYAGSGSGRYGGQGT
ncbi:MAG: hypothetical protein ACRDYE_03085, partial [Acidimicrobiales bacterium]